MSTRIITLGENREDWRPVVKLVGSASLPIWHYAGVVEELGEGAWMDGASGINRSASMAARDLARKVGDRKVRVELVIQPLMPSIAVHWERLVPIMTAIADNASASVEPGPATVSLCTWWEDSHAGLDAVGHGGCIDPIVRARLMAPGFTTRVAEWDTGFGLFEANALAAQIGASVSMVDSDIDTVFRWTIPLRNATPASPPFCELGRERHPAAGRGIWPMPTRNGYVLGERNRKGRAHARHSFARIEA